VHARAARARFSIGAAPLFSVARALVNNILIFRKISARVLVWVTHDLRVVAPVRALFVDFFHVSKFSAHGRRSMQRVRRISRLRGVARRLVDVSQFARDGAQLGRLDPQSLDLVG
jgi:hypothetical protein